MPENDPDDIQETRVDPAMSQPKGPTPAPPPLPGSREAKPVSMTVRPTADMGRVSGAGPVSDMGSVEGGGRRGRTDFDLNNVFGEPEEGGD